MGKRGFYAWHDYLPLVHKTSLSMLLSGLYVKHGTLQGVADALGISRSRLYVGMRDKGLTLESLKGE